MRVTSFCALIAMTTGAASAQVTFYVNDQAGFDAAVANATPFGELEDFENNDAPDASIIGIPSPLEGGVGNGPFFEGLRNDNLAIESFDIAGNPAVSLVLITEGALGAHTDVVGSDLFADQTQITSDVALYALEFDVYSYTGANFTNFVVYDLNGEVIGEGGGSMNEPSHFGIVSEGGDIGAVRVIRANDLGELLDNIQMYTSEGNGCYPDCNGDGELNILDFVCFQGIFQNGDDNADCNGDGELNILDFVCFQGEFQAGC